MRSAASESMAKAEVLAQLTAENTRPDTLVGPVLK
jgi:hypothetical protein